MPTRAVEAWHAVTITIVSPDRTITDPSACFASLPVSMLRVRAPIVRSRRCAVGIIRSGTKAEPRGQRDASERVAGRSDVWRPSAAGASPYLGIRLLADAEFLNQVSVSIQVLSLQVVEEPAPLADELQEPATRMVIL